LQNAKDASAWLVQDVLSPRRSEVTEKGEPTRLLDHKPYTENLSGACF